MVRYRIAYPLFCLVFAMLACGKRGESRTDEPQTETAAMDISSAEDSAAVSDADEPETATTASSGGDKCGKFLDEYDAWADSYVSFMNDYKRNPSDTRMISRLAEMSSRSAAMAAEAQSAECSTGTDVQRMLTIQQKIASAM